MEKAPEGKEKESAIYPSRRRLVSPVSKSPTAELKLAAIAISLNIRLRSADMPNNMQERALRYTRSLIDTAPDNPPNPSHLARALKKARVSLSLHISVDINYLLLQEFDSSYGPAWHCVVGTSFGSFVTHSLGGFVYFSIDSLSFLLFKTEVRLVLEPPP
ncbi:hypothetical protein HHK36_003700 [Tetracentron sinense]|uniref:Dynein light chain n=1 Tax=Tetracentron sinense TaxID=13715 RepID=A0A834ZYZ4_TETSI|nr:hypothetical protein HHK36_003700 [Tetracentron sinense]